MSRLIRRVHGQPDAAARLAPRRGSRALVAALALTALAGARRRPAQRLGRRDGIPRAPRPTKTLTIAGLPGAGHPRPDGQAPVASAQVQLYNVYETLVKIDCEGVPAAAARPALGGQPGRLTYTFYLNPAAKFASGKPVTADAVAQNIERVRTGRRGRRARHGARRVPVTVGRQVRDLDEGGRSARRPWTPPR